MTSNIIDFKTREAIAVGRATGRVEQYIKKLDESLLELMEVIYQESDTLADEEVWDIYDMEKHIKGVFKGLCREPEHYNSYINAREWRVVTEAYYETQGVDIQLDLDGEDDE